MSPVVSAFVAAAASVENDALGIKLHRIRSIFVPNQFTILILHNHSFLYLESNK